jgi:hypothetical protein
MLFVPKEIFSLINSKTVSLFLTCKNFYESVDVFYREFKFDVSINPIVLTSGVLINHIVRKKDI